MGSDGAVRGRRPVRDGSRGVPLLLAHEDGEVEREAVRVEHRERVGPTQRAAGVELLAPLLELGDPLLQRARERRLLLLEHLLHRRRVLTELREAVGHHLDDDVDELVEEALGRLEDLAAVADGAAEDAAEDVAAPLVRRQRAVGDRRRQRAHVIGDHPVRRVAADGGARQHLRRRLGEEPAVRLGLGHQLDLFEDRILVGQRPVVEAQLRPRRALPLRHRRRPFRRFALRLRRRRRLALRLALRLRRRVRLALRLRLRLRLLLRLRRRLLLLDQVDLHLGRVHSILVGRLKVQHG